MQMLKTITIQCPGDIQISGFKKNHPPFLIVGTVEQKRGFNVFIKGKRKQNPSLSNQVLNYPFQTSDCLNPNYEFNSKLMRILCKYTHTPF